MGTGTLKLNLNGFKDSLKKGFLLSDQTAFEYIDMKQFVEKERTFSSNKQVLTLPNTFCRLRERTSPRYFKNVLLAQLEALDYASLLFPAYKFIAPEDLADDWLATVDIHNGHARDHSFHQPLTAYCAGALLGFGDANASMRIPAAPGNLLDYCVDSILEKSACDYLREYAALMGVGQSIKGSEVEKEYWKKLFYKSVILAALFHDIGYPWQYVKTLEHPLEDKLLAGQGMTDNVGDCIATYRDKLFMVPFRHYCSSPVNPPLKMEGYDKQLITEALGTHGMLGAQAFLTLNDMFRKYPSPSGRARQHEFSVEWAALGIMMHDLVKLNQPGRRFRIDFNKDPLSSIVTMADYLEEFNRPRAMFKQVNNRLTLHYGEACKEVRLSVEDSVLDIRMTSVENNDLANAKRFKSDETQRYFKTGSGYIDMTSIGVQKVVCRPIR